MKTIINDTADVVFRRKRDKFIIFTAEAQLASISQKVQEEKIKGGIGNKTIASLKSEKEIELAVRNAVFDRAWLEMAQGVEFTSANNVLVYKKEETVVTGGKITTKGTIDGSLQVTEKTGKVLVATKDDTKPKEITVTGAKDGDMLNVLYQTSVSNADVLEIRGDTFSEAYEVEYHTIEYNPETNKVAKDIYFQFDKVSPSDAFDMSFENGKPLAPEFKFTAMSPLGSEVIGRVIEVDRV
ncbi:hypothetical protein COE51_16380 [Bacillus pseudomycoides]|nr:hypothetical protein COE51_16380 [Bacillus pseudomycoides]